MKVVVDSGIPYIKGVLEPYAQIIYKEGSTIGKADVRDASALIIRTRTKCNEELLSGSNLKFVATATIGKDHVDEDYCLNNNIYFTNAAGCNSFGVVQYVLTALFSLNIYDLKGKTIGIIGAGNIGERLANLASVFGMNVLRCDPPLKNSLKENPKIFKNDFLRSSLKFEDYHSIDYVLGSSDIISLHVPFDESTSNMAGKSFFMKMKPGSVFINTSRGEVVDEETLIKFENKFSAIVLDVWKEEPSINRTLMNLATIATPHIAGYSLEGKINATVMSINSFGSYFDIDALRKFKIDLPPFPKLKNRGTIASILNEIFPIKDIDSLLRNNPERFEQLRLEYNYRREIPDSIIELVNKNSAYDNL